VRVLFWGTPEFATSALRALIGEGFDVVGVVTQPDKPVGRSRSTLQPPPVKQIALEEGIAVLQPERPRGPDFLEQLRALEPDISVVVAYGHLLPRDVIELPTHGTVNIHASLLPRLRGAAPIQAAIREGLTETGVTIMRMVQALDAGPMLLKVATPIVDDETYGELAERLSEMGALACVEALALIELGRADEEPQDDGVATYAPKIDRVATRIDWRTDAQSIGRVIRAYDPRPGALTTLRGQDVKLFGARPSPADRREAPGTVLEIDDQAMTVACGGGCIRVLFVQPAGKRRMAPLEWARGRGISLGDRFGTDVDSGP
jgi:methionyl-tRNA formyltransferase